MKRKEIMKKIFTIFTVLACSGMLMAQKPAPMPKFEDAVSFYIPFDDETPNADITVGKEKPTRILGKKTCVFGQGVRGQALLCGQNGSRVRFSRMDNLDFSKPGTIVFFYKGAFKSLKSGPRVFFWGIESNRGYVGQQLANDPKKICPCKRDLHTLFLYGKRIKNKILETKLSGGEAGCEKWHMISFSWTPGQISIKYDNEPGKSYQVPFDMRNADFPADQFTIGNSAHWEYYLDEFTIYNRRLSDSELAEIYQCYFKKQPEK
jgi:hypothetical protein